MDISYSRQKSVMITGSTSTANKSTEKKLHLPLSLLQSPLIYENCSGCEVWNIALPRHIILGHHQSSSSLSIALLLCYLKSWWASDTSFGIYKQNTCFQPTKSTSYHQIFLGPIADISPLCFSQYWMFPPMYLKVTHGWYSCLFLLKLLLHGSMIFGVT